MIQDEFLGGEATTDIASRHNFQASISGTVITIIVRDDTKFVNTLFTPGTYQIDLNSVSDTNIINAFKVGSDCKFVSSDDADLAYRSLILSHVKRVELAETMDATCSGGSCLQIGITKTGTTDIKCGATGNGG